MTLVVHLPLGTGISYGLCGMISERIRRQKPLPSIELKKGKLWASEGDLRSWRAEAKIWLTDALFPVISSGITKIVTCHPKTPKVEPG